MRKRERKCINVEGIKGKERRKTQSVNRERMEDELNRERSGESKEKIERSREIRKIIYIWIKRRRRKKTR